MKALITEVEVLDEINNVIAKLKAFDEESFIVELKQDIWSPDQLRELANLLGSEWLYKEYKIKLGVLE